MKIYTDGATSKNGQDGAIGGWAFVVVNDKDEIILKKVSSSIKNTTNNICELLALINACEYAKNSFEHVTLYSDSAYCINCYKQGWYKQWEKNGWVNSKKQPVANKELWKQLIPFFKNHNFSFEKVPGHSNNKWNNMADKLAVEAKNG